MLRALINSNAQPERLNSLRSNSSRFDDVSLTLIICFAESFISDTPLKIAFRHSEGETRRISKTVNEILRFAQDDEKQSLLLAGEGDRSSDEVSVLSRGGDK